MPQKMSNATIPFLAAKDSPEAAEWVGALRAAMPDERIVTFEDLNEEARTEARLAIVANPDPTDLRGLPKLCWVHSVWAGVERLLADPENSRLHIVRLLDPQLAATMAEAVLAWTLFLHREMPAYARQQAQQLWQPRPYLRPELRTLGLLGLGALGSASAERLLAAGFKVCGWSRQEKFLPGVECFAGDAGLAEMLARTDILICLLPLTLETRGLLSADRLARLPTGASLINFARGPIIVDEDLRAVLDSGQLEHAVLDVFAREPLPTDQWQWRHPRVTVLPHCSAQTDRETASRIVADNIRRYRETGELPASVDVARGY
jgi:glyoxylate/hydroxypyruvate reductase A